MGLPALDCVEPGFRLPSSPPTTAGALIARMAVPALDREAERLLRAAFSIPHFLSASAPIAGFQRANSRIRHCPAEAAQAIGWSFSICHFRAADPTECPFAPPSPPGRPGKLRKRKAPAAIS